MSTQNVQTPWNFLKAMEEYFKVKFMYDMAACAKSSKAPYHYNEWCNSLKTNWPIDGNLFLNPTFKNLTEWINKCEEQKDRWCKIYTIWPLSGDLNQIPVFKGAQVNIIHGRIWPNVRACVVCVWDKEKGEFIQPVHGLRWGNDSLIKLGKKTLTRIW